MNKFFKNKFSKKGMSQMWWIIGSAILVLVMVLLILLWFRGSGGSAFDTINDKIGGLGDCDGDKVADTFDKCVCDDGPESGCPKGASQDMKDMTRKKCEEANKCKDKK